jgi:hypothetical protein
MDTDTHILMHTQDRQKDTHIDTETCTPRQIYTYMVEDTLTCIHRHTHRATHTNKDKYRYMQTHRKTHRQQQTASLSLPILCMRTPIHTHKLPSHYTCVMLSTLVIRLFYLITHTVVISKTKLFKPTLQELWPIRQKSDKSFYIPHTFHPSHFLSKSPT